MTWPLVLLTFESRSGSTLLASRLASIPGVFVTLESDLPSLVVTAEDRRWGSDVLLSKLKEDKKFAAWGPDWANVLEAIDGARGSALSVLRAVARNCSPIESPRAIVLKGVPPALLDRFLREGGENTMVLHVVRDPRSVYLSQLRSVDSARHVAMTSGPVSTARRWRRTVSVVRALPPGQVIETRFEDLVADESSVIEKIVGRLGFQVPGDVQADARTYAERIPESQRHLHTKISEKGDINRIDAWRREVHAVEAWMIERIAGDIMPVYGYMVPKRRARDCFGMSGVLRLLHLARESAARARKLVLSRL